MSHWNAEVVHTITAAFGATWTNIVDDEIFVDPDDRVHFQALIDNQELSVTDAIEIGIFATTDDDDAQGNEDDIPARSFLYLPTGIAAERISFSVEGWRRYLLKARSGGATDEYKVTTTHSVGRMTG